MRNVITERFVTVKITIYATRLLQETSGNKRDLNRGKNMHVARISPTRSCIATRAQITGDLLWLLAIKVN